MAKLRRYFNFHSIKTHMVLSFMMLISMIVLFVSLVSYQYTIRDFEGLSINYTVRLLSEINAGIDSYVENMKSIAQVVVSNRDVRELMDLYVTTHGKVLSYREERQLFPELRSAVMSHLNTVKNTRNDITNVAVISKYKDVVLSDPTKSVNEYSEFNLSDWYLKPLSNRHEIIVSPSHVQNLVEGEYKWVISLSMAITNSAGEVTGVMVIDLNYQSIEDICENAQLGKNGYIYLIDDRKNIIYHPQQQLIYSGVKSELVDEILDMRQAFMRRDRENKIYAKNHSPVTGWSAVGVVNTDELLANRVSIIRFYFYLAAVSLVVASFIAVIISTTITKPIKALENTMHRVEEGDLTVQSDIALENEIGHLGNTFNVMVKRIKRLMDSAVANEEEKRKSEIRALQAQINPHFLYNTLDAIIWMSAAGKNEEVVEMTSALAELFRTSINKGDSLVSLANEIENIKSYLTIQKMRYGDKLAYEVRIPEDLRGWLTPKLILQPIVENAVYHGIKLSPEGGTITIGARRTQKLLILTVEDSGVGMTEEQTARLFEPKENSDRGIGIINVNDRIRLTFGGEYGLHYYSGVGKGTRVEIWLPLMDREGARNV